MTTINLYPENTGTNPLLDRARKALAEEPVEECNNVHLRNLVEDLVQQIEGAEAALDRKHREDAYHYMIANPEPAPSLYDLTNEASYDPEFGDDRECKCGHTYYRHFDSYEDMEPVGCKYCGCSCFEDKEDSDVR